MVVIAILAILALLALPGVPDKLIRERLVESVKLADIVKAPVADKIVNDYISSVAVESGAIQITFGNHAHPSIVGKVLTLRPGVIEDATVVPVSWVCGDASPPERMVAKGLNKTNVPARYLPINCRGPGSTTHP